MPVHRVMFVVMLCVCYCDVPFTVMLQSAQHPCSHTPALLLCVFIALTITSMAPALPAFTLLSAVNPSGMPLHRVVVILVCYCDVPLSVMFMSAQHPCSHTPALLLCVFIALTITSMAPALPAFTWLSSVNPSENAIPLCCHYLFLVVYHDVP